MKNQMKNKPLGRNLLSLVLSLGLALPLPALSASVSLATSPLATSTTSTIKPNLLMVLDNSGSMDWDHMPDDTNDGGSAVTWIFGYYGLRSSQCNQVYYDPAITYLPPVDAAGASYANSSFTAAWTNGFNTGAGTVNLSTSYIASQSLNADSSGRAAYYYSYSGTQLSSTQKNYNSTTNAFYKECSSSVNSALRPVNDVAAGTGLSAPGTGVFTKHRLSTTETTTIEITGTEGVATPVSSITVNGVQLMSGAAPGSTTASTFAGNIAAKITLNGFSATASGSTVTITGPTSAADYTPVITYAGTFVLTPNVFPDTTASKLTNFANWYSYYRTRMLMMKTAAGRAFSSLGNNYRVGLMKISASTSPTVPLGTFESTKRSDWYNALYATTVSGSTPLRTALSNAGRYYAGKLSGVTDPLEASCQQNFSILSTDGYWNAGDDVDLSGTSNSLGNQDGNAARPYYDGALASTTVTVTYTQYNYYCKTSKDKLYRVQQTGTCTVAGTPGTASCTPTNWSPSSATTSDTYLGACSTITSRPLNLTEANRASSPPTGGSSDSLADVAMYYYMTDLRTPALGNCGTAVSPATVGPLCENNVFKSSTDDNLQQHMTTFTLGLGASGWMNYSSSYLSDLTGDYMAVKQGTVASSTVCTWQTAGTTCNWPIPGMTSVASSCDNASGASNGCIANIDDLWHAAVNGRGVYFSATNPTTLSAGLSNALAGINSRKGSAAAAATSTLNPVAGNNNAYVASYTTMKWQGNLEARGINTDTGQVNENANWCVENVPAGTCSAPGSVVAEVAGDTTSYYCVTPGSVICNGGTLVGTDCKVPVATACVGTMNSKVTDVSDTRMIQTANSAGTALTNFDAAYAAANPTNFAAAHISTLTQWTSLTAAQQAVAEGTNLINFLRGQYGYEERTANPAANRLYRQREAVLGDALESQPIYSSKPIFGYPYPGYSEYATAQAGTAGTVFMGANDGMLHAFNADTGVERWAYVPTMVIANMWKLADMNYATQHANFVNGSPLVTDVCTANCNNPYSFFTPGSNPVWKTVLVGGLNGGGRGYYALDVTDPAVPVLLWEITTTTGTGKIKDDDMGYSYGVPVVTQKNDGTWVALLTSGYNNTSPGTGRGFLYVLDIASGAIISKIDTGVGSTTTPSGLAKIAGWNNEPAGNRAGYVYGGDLLGNVWRFDINSTSPTAIGNGSAFKFATLFSDTAGSNPQPVTTTPVLAKIAEKRVIMVGTGKYLETTDLTNTQKQSMYALKDDDVTTTVVNPRTLTAATPKMVNQTVVNNTNGTATRVGSNAAVNFYTDRGWYIDFPDSGERVNIDPKLVLGTLLVPTIVPSNTACSPGGYGWLNFFNYETGGYVTTTTLVSLKYDSTIVGVNVLYIDGKPKVAVVTSTNPTPEMPSTEVPFTNTQTGFRKQRAIWRELIP